MGGEPAAEQPFSVANRRFRSTCSPGLIDVGRHPPLIAPVGTTSAQYALTLG